MTNIQTIKVHSFLWVQELKINGHTFYDKDDKYKLEENNPLFQMTNVEGGEINKLDYITGNF